MLPSQLKLAQFKDCHVRLPQSFIHRQQNVQPGSIVSIRSVQTEIELCLQWNGQISASDQVQLDLAFAQANQLQDELIILTIVPDLQPLECSLCRVELLDNSDYNILSQHSDINILDSCRLVQKNLVIPIYLSANVKVLVRVMDMCPEQDFGILTKWTEMQFQHGCTTVTNSSTKRETTDNELHEDLNPTGISVTFVDRALGCGYKRKFYPGAMLICGAQGSGKTHMLKSIIDGKPNHYSMTILCSQFRGKRPESVCKTLRESLRECLDKQPSILCLDDLDALVGNQPKLEDVKGQEAVYRHRMVDAVKALIQELLDSKGHTLVCMIASSKSLESLDPLLSKPRGCKYFNKVIEIGPPSEQQRQDIIQAIIGEDSNLRHNLTPEQLREVAAMCNLYTPADLRKLVERSITSASHRWSLEFNCEPLCIESSDLIRAMQDFIPSRLRGVDANVKANTKRRTLADVGGLEEAKSALEKTITMLAKYPKLFKKLPTRPQTCVLLYGPPGCGKTLLAEAITSQPNLNSIFVRGPELLSKYIGASEKAVRDLFKRAELARPCVLVFDEFESLVARRGTDSTGVTDRIVNQFLTLMDGVDDLSRDVFIVAVSSRPDMIDPAVLRPGRLDRHVYIAPPNERSRVEIIRVLARHIGAPSLVGASGELERWSKELDGFTGADIQSWLYGAQLRALQGALEKGASACDVATHSGAAGSVEVRDLHLAAALAELRPDVLARSRRLLADYPKAFGGRDRLVASRATLA